ncbi:MBL fold metallo-hydrolase [Acetobacter fallax]|uniref:Metallo-beta-lactamase domain-containing protein n=1 Tax=Acetobacter fallax TaxID=1737473 RepID=A0ABX0KBJ8_9PROT|nr:MBL fold metallo-hydrolase [Acetobacter fallax]NHO32411.1 hypothetical protein [Acetobacter fallax]NHO35921.1 hypothetical protein [Acetobacter fallax]
MPFVFPVSDHCDGEHFSNLPLPASWQPAPRPPAWPDDPIPGAAPASGRKRGVRPALMLRWMISMARDQQKQISDPIPTGDPHAIPDPGTVSVTMIGHCTFLLRLRQKDGSVLTALTDPIFSERCSPFSFFGPKRLRPPGRLFKDLPKIDLLLISHCHYDHLDLPSLRSIARRDNPVVITPLNNGDILRKAGQTRIAEQDWWQSSRMGDTEITCTPARHFSQRSPWDASKRLWSGFMLRTPQPDNAPPLSIFFAGDSAHSPHWQTIHDRLGPPDLALLPIGAYAPRNFLKAVHVDPVEAVAAFRSLNARRGIPMHYDTFPLSREPPGEAERCLAETAAWAGLAPDAFAPMAFGETQNILLR